MSATGRAIRPHRPGRRHHRRRRSPRPRHAEAVAAPAASRSWSTSAPITSKPTDRRIRRIGSGLVRPRMSVDITDPKSVEACLEAVLERYGRVDVLINNAANNPKVEAAPTSSSRALESLPLEQWDADLAVGLTGAFLCSRVIGGEMARRATGVIVNVASDLALIGPDQRLYRQTGASRRPPAGQAGHVLGRQVGAARPDPLPRDVLGDSRRPRQRDLARRSLTPTSPRSSSSGSPISSRSGAWPGRRV